MPSPAASVINISRATGKVPFAGLWRAMGTNPDSPRARHVADAVVGLPIVAAAAWLFLAYLGVL